MFFKLWLFVIILLFCALLIAWYALVDNSEEVEKFLSNLKNLMKKR